jgi:hypothetical protein
MIDLDLSEFKHNNNCMKAMNLAKEKTLAKIQDTFDLSKKFEPATVIWSGNGYHLYIPAESYMIRLTHSMWLYQLFLVFRLPL